MKKLLYIGGGSLLLLLTLAFGALFAGPLVASAHTASTPTTPTTTQTTKTDRPAERPLREFVNKYSEEVINQIAPQLHLSADQLKQKLQSGERLVKIAKEQGISRDSLKTILVTSTDKVIGQELDAKKIDQKQADQLKDLVHNHPFVVAHVLHRHYYKK